MAGLFLHGGGAASSYKLPPGAAFLFTPGSLQHDGNGRVTGWRDRVSNTVLGTNGNVVYRAADPLLNNQASAEINGAAWFDPFQLSTAGPLTVALVNVCTKPQSHNRDSLFYICQRDAAGKLYAFNQGSNGVVPNWDGVGTDFGIGGYDYREPMLLSMSATNVFDAHTVNLYREGTQLLLNPLPAGYSQPAAPATWWLGYVQADTSFSFIGRYSFVVIYTRILSDPELRQLHGYLRRRYNFIPFE